MSDETEVQFASESISKETVDAENDVNDEQEKSIEKQENFIQEIPKITDDTSVLELKFSDKPNNEVNNVGGSEDVENLHANDSSVKKYEMTDWLMQIDEVDEKNIYEKLKDATKDELLEIITEIERINLYILKENEVYEFILNEDETAQNSVDKDEVDEEISIQESFVLTYPAKCYFAKKKLEHTEIELELKKAGYANELQNLNFELESLNMSLKDLKESKEKFDKNIRIGGRHPVTKKIILQKVMKYFDDSIRTKMALANRNKIQIQSDMMERNKILSQIKAQEKRLASLDMTEFKEAQFEHKKSCKQLAMRKEQLGKFKIKFSPFLQSIAEMKRALEREQSEMEQMKRSVSKLEHLKEVMLTEKTRNDQKVIELKAAMRKIKLDPRRHDLPEVIDYAAAKRENAALRKNINKWKKKVEHIQQEKLLYLNALSKKNKY